MKHLLNQRHLKLLYNAYLKSQLEYGASLFCCANSTTIKPIIILQKKAVRILTGSGYRDHSHPLFVAEKLLTFEKIIFLNQARFMYDYTKNLLPPFFANRWRFVNELHNYNVRTARDIHLERINKPYLISHPLFHFPTVWNSIPSNIRLSNSRKIFTNKLTTYLLDLPQDFIL